MPKFFAQYKYNTNQGVFFEDESALPAQMPSEPAARYIAYYLPQFHETPDNSRWWVPGFTEWTNTTKTVPRYQGHYQPRLPEKLGFYDLGTVEALQQQADLMKRGGVYGVCIHDYWFAGRKTLEKPLELILDNPDLDIKFCLNWANEKWTKRWIEREDDVLLDQEHSVDNDIGYLHSIIKYIEDPRYIRINGRPLIMIYRPTLMVSPRESFQAWRDILIERGLGDPYIVIAQSFDDADPREFGADAAAGFPPHNGGWNLKQHRDSATLFDQNFNGDIRSYDDLAETILATRSEGYVRFPGVCPQWDNEARKPGKGFGFVGSTPAKYGAWLEQASRTAMAEAPSPDERIVFINAWNEWGEGAYLEPDRHFGFAYLAETARTLLKLSSSAAAPAERAEAAEIPPHLAFRPNPVKALIAKALRRAKLYTRQWA